MSLKELGTRLYFLIFGPIYRRLSRDASLRIQELARVQVEFQERWAAIISDELIALSLRANSQAHDLTDRGNYSPADIIETAGRIHKSQDLVALSQEMGIPLNDMAQFYIKYSDVNASGIVRLLALEEELQGARALVQKIQSSNNNEPSSGILSGTPMTQPASPMFVDLQKSAPAK